MFAISKPQNKQVTISFKALILISVVLCSLIVGGILLGANWDTWFGAAPPDPGPEGFIPDLDENAGDHTGEKPKDEGGAAVGIKIPGYPSIPVKAGQKQAYVSLLNPEGNPCYFVFNLVLQEGGEVLYTSKMVPPGKAITEVTLSRALEAGEYAATIQISTYALSDGSPMNGANVETVLKVH